MQRTDFHAMHKAIHLAELYELKQVVKNFGGMAFFGEPADCDDDERREALTGPYATHAKLPMIAVNLHNFDEHPENVVVLSVMVDNDNRLIIWAEQQNSIGDPFELDPDDIEFGYVSLITDCIPDRDLS